MEKSDSVGEALVRLTEDVCAALGASPWSEAQVLQALEAFNSHFHDPALREFTKSPEEKSQKQRFVEALLGLLENEAERSLPEQLVAAALRALCVIAREKQPPAALIQENVVELLLRKANLVEQTTPYTAEVQEEATKSLVNIVILNNSLKSLFYNSEHTPVQRLIKRLKEQGTDKCFATGRLLLHLALDRPKVKQLNEMGAVDVVIDLLEQVVSGVESNGALKPKDIALGMDLLRMLFALTVFLGPLETPPNPPPTEEEKAQWKRLAPFIQTIMNLPMEPRYHELKHAAVNCLINTPQGCADYFTLNERTFKSLTLYLKAELDQEDETQVVPILMVLLAVVTGIPVARAYCLNFCFPNKPPPIEGGKQAVEPPPNWQENPVGSKLIKLITSFNSAVKHYVTEFIFALCGSDVDEFVRYVGFGNASAMMAQRGLFKAFMGGGGSHASSSSSSSRTSSSPLRPAFARRAEEGEEPEEEKERQMADLAERMQRLMDAGVIKVITKDDKDKDKDKEKEDDNK
ncbi:AAA-ATPase vps4-associated 1 domain-containing [Balamuthia mandrillaris]